MVQYEISYEVGKGDVELMDAYVGGDGSTAKCVSTATNKELLTMRTSFRIKRMAAMCSGDSGAHLNYDTVLSVLDYQLTQNCAQGVQYVDGQPFMFRNSRTYWGDEAIRISKEIQQ